jgi:magnesium transporter
VESNTFTNELTFHDIFGDLQNEDFSAARNKLDALHPTDIALIIGSSPTKQREKIWGLIDPEVQGEVLSYLNEETRKNLLDTIETHEIVAVTESLPTDDLADLIQDLPQRAEEIILSLDTDRRKRLESVLSYPEDVAGGVMDLDAVTIREDVSIDVVLRYMRKLGNLPHTTDQIFVLDRDGNYQGSIFINDLIVTDPDQSVSSILKIDTPSIPADTAVAEVATLFEKLDLVSAPVVDYNQKLLGRITVDDVIDIIREEGAHSFMSMAGLDEETDTFAPVIKSTQRRSVWLGINLITAFLAAWVIGLFDATIEQMVALAVLMPVVASMGGIAGSQTLTIVIRSIALGQLGKNNTRWLFNKELLIGLLNGGIWAVIIALISYLWFEQVGLAVVIGFAILINLIFAAMSGAVIPLVLHKMNIDPALAGGVVLTTVTDVIGFMAFLGLATLYLI